MNKAALFRRVNNQTRRDAKLILNQYAEGMQWCKYGGDTLLDIGTGPGDVLMDFIYPLMPSNFKEIVGTDISEKMLSYARKCYVEFKRVKFEVLDIGADELPNHMIGRFDHVTSFYCLHWIQNLSKALENIKQLLRSNSGDCLLVFLAKCNVSDVYKVMVKMPKWSVHLQDCLKSTSSLHDSADPAAEFVQLLQQAGFVDYQVDIRNDFFMYDSQRFRGLIRSICPSFEHIPVALQEDFLDDFTNIAASMNLRQAIKNSDDYEYTCKYTLLIAYGRKPDNIK